MLHGRVAEVVGVAALATVITAAIAAPVVRAPSERLFGMDIVGRHHDPFTVMAQFERPVTVGVYSQPVTDIPGAMLARVAGGVAAYNWLVLLSFPLSAVAAFLLARYLQLSPAGATVAAMAYAFSPFHLAHAAYHPHIAQIQWIPLYLLALWRCLDRATPAAVAFLGLATAWVTLSNFYGGLIAAVITPVAVAGHWAVISRRASAHSLRTLSITVGSLVLIAASGAAYVIYAARAVLANRADFAFPRIDLFHYSARWWSYLVPPVEHPLLGATARRVWNEAGVRDGLLEQQVSLGWGIVALALTAGLGWLWHDRRPASTLHVPVLAGVAAIAFLCSLSPEWLAGGITVVRPSSLLYDLVPMFRSYARFGVVVQLMAALLAGIGVDCLRRRGSRRAQIAWVALVALAAGEYAVRPSLLWRDVLPTAGHRWAVQQAGEVHVLDCMPLDRNNQSIPWLTASRVTMRGSATNDCTEPNFARKIAAIGYTHLLIRTDTSEGRWFAKQPAVDGLRLVADSEDARVFTVTAAAPELYTAAMTGFFRREHNAQRSWRWMGSDAAWTIVNAGAEPIVATLAVELTAFQRARPMRLALDGCHVQEIVVARRRRMYEIGPLTILPGNHELVFHSPEAPPAAGVAASAAGRRLSIAVGRWDWRAQSRQP